MTRPTPANLAVIRSTLPVRRVAAPVAAARKPNAFASMLQTASVPKAPRALTNGANSLTMGGMMPATVSRPSVNPTSGAGLGSISRSQIVANAQSFMGVPYVWGGNSATGLDCSAFVSKAWGIGRHTTDNFANVARKIDKDDLQTGDILNLTTSQDVDGAGHVRMFDTWADASHTKMWVYEETPPRSLHHVINWDPSYTPMRRLNVTD